MIGSTWEWILYYGYWKSVRYEEDLLGIHPAPCWDWGSLMNNITNKNVIPFRVIYHISTRRQTQDSSVKKHSQRVPPAL